MLNRKNVFFCILGQSELSARVLRKEQICTYSWLTQYKKIYEPVCPSLNHSGCNLFFDLMSRYTKIQTLQRKFCSIWNICISLLPIFSCKGLNVMSYFLIKELLLCYIADFLHIHVCLSVFLTVYLFVCLVWLCICLYVCLFFFLSL